MNASQYFVKKNPLSKECEGVRRSAKECQGVPLLRECQCNVTIFTKCNRFIASKFLNLVVGNLVVNVA